jgi:TRAP-type C4-dicarboxylate transport system permease small subunit
MKARPQETRKKRRVAIDAALLFVVILLITQMWLLTATLESYLAGHRSVALPGLIISACLFAGCLAIYFFVERLDRAPEREEEPHGLGPWDIH